MTGRRGADTMNAMRIACLLLLMLVAACTPGPTMQQQLSTFIGRSEADLVAQLGVPVRTHEAEGRRFLQYEQRRTVAVAQPGLYGPGYGPWGPRWRYAPPPPALATVGCDITFALREGRVESFSFRGQGC
jgi:hypothetical protein